MIVFDKEAPGGGVDAYTVLENGKAEIHFTVYLVEGGVEDSGAVKGGAVEDSVTQEGKPKEREIEALCSVTVEITMFDPKGKETARMRLQPMRGETLAKSLSTEPLTTRTLLIYPQLWQSVANPLLYRVKACISAGDTVMDTKEFPYPICSMRSIPDKGFFLNQKSFTLHAVQYSLTKDWRKFLDKDLDILVELGANCLCPDRFPKDSMFYEKCLEKGLIVWKLVSEQPSIPRLWGGDKPLVSADRLRRQDLFYYYQACWSNREVLHICNHEKMPRPGTMASAVVYSNQKKVALYVNGVLQEFKQTPPVCVFEDIVVKGEHMVVSAQAGECFASVTWG